MGGGFQCGVEFVRGSQGRHLSGGDAIWNSGSENSSWRKYLMSLNHFFRWCATNLYTSQILRYPAKHCQVWFCFWCTQWYSRFDPSTDMMYVCKGQIRWPLFSCTLATLANGNIGSPIYLALILFLILKDSKLMVEKLVVLDIYQLWD